MSKLYTLFYGKSKKKMKPIMTDILHKCENYMKARNNVIGFHEIKNAEPGLDIWRKKSCTVGGNRPDGVSGYISKRGFQYHT